MVTVAGNAFPLDEEHGEDNIGGHGNTGTISPPSSLRTVPPLHGQEDHDAQVLAAQFPSDGPRGTPAAAAWNAHAEKVLSVYRRTFHTEPGRPNFIRDPSETVVRHNVKATFTRSLFTEMFRDMGVPDTGHVHAIWLTDAALRFLGFLGAVNLLVGDDPCRAGSHLAISTWLFLLMRGVGEESARRSLVGGSQNVYDSSLRLRC
ncbi:hypothetical protein BDZ88DRAFT_481304 [Geranomyces variabilis]|nr:hypothetical protein BDZ88DRAFT_481304 [Geranomyces variabilis]KAJ3143663.1 hypothetical protein HDU90_000427 [Geranomyces variabilis]